VVSKGISAGLPGFACEDFKPCGWKLNRRQNTGKQGFVLEIRGRSVLALLGNSIEQAKALCSEAWFLEELVSYRSCGNPIWDGEAKLSLRHAGVCETAELEVALRSEQKRHEYEGYVFVFLVPVDVTLQ
jgi:hypothetical protein